ncbi:MAG: hypothetical protein VYE15_03845, partial [Myxococcota bacterium]|nr:hypothetical protein [Myxococcota bacterium]
MSKNHCSIYARYACVGALALALVATASATQAATPEEEAALLLFNEGRTAFGEGEYEKALKHFIDAQVVIDNAFIQYYLSRSYAALGRCAEALPGLTSLAGKLPPDAEAPRKEDQRRCLLQEARKHVKAVRCAEALPLLEQMEGLVTGADEDWRAGKVPWCEARITDFITDTPSRKAAYKLYLAGKAGEEAGDLDKAATMYRKAQALADDPYLRERLAWVLTQTSDCATIYQALEDQAHPLVVACNQYDATDLQGAPRRAYLFDVVAGLKARTAGDNAAAAVALAAAVGKAPVPALVALRTDILFDLGRCDGYLELVTNADPAVRPLITDVDKRVEHCESPPPPSGGGETSVAVGGEAGISTAASTGGGSNALELGLIGAGGAAVVGAVVVAILRMGDVSAMSDAEAIFNDSSDVSLSA